MMAERLIKSPVISLYFLVLFSTISFESLFAAVPPVSVGLQSANDSGVDNSDNITNLVTPTIDITAANIGDTVNVYKDGQLLGEALLTDGNLYQYTLTQGQLSEGLNTITARSFDTVEESLDSPPLEIVLDTLGPQVVSTGPASPVNLRTDVFDHITIVFNETINVNASQVPGIDVDDISIIGPNGAVPANQITSADFIEFTVSFDAQTTVGDYAVTVHPDLVDLAGNLMNQDLDNIHGEADEDTFEFQIRVVDVDQVINQALTILSTDTAFENLDLYISAAAVVIEGSHQFNSLQLGEGATVTSPAQTPLTITINNDLTLYAGSAISVNGKGFGSTSGTGAGVGARNGAGAGFGGRGGNGGTSSGLPYGSIAEPVDVGSGGGYGWYTSQQYVAGGSGGGAVHVTVNGELVIEGSITANGTNGGAGKVYTAYWSGGGGSGGSIWLDVNTISGTGVIAANGGNAGWTNRAGGGGGGRVALYYQINNFNGGVTAQGGAGSQYGGSGTVYMKSGTDVWGHLQISNAGGSSATTPLPEGATTFDSVSSSNAAKLEVPAASILNLAQNQLQVHDNGEFVIYGQVRNVDQDKLDTVRIYDAGKITLADGGNVNCSYIEIASNARLVLEDGAMLACDQLEILADGAVLLNTSASFSQMHIAAGGLLTHRKGDTDFDLTVANDLIVDVDGKINVNGLGYGPASGPGASSTSGNGGGAGYGGNGGNGSSSGGTAYGDFTSPSDLGSGAGGGWYTSQQNVSGGSGGGAVRITVNGELGIEGSITANGTNGGAGKVYTAYWSGGGGSGGSVWLDVNALSGGGVITANGGNGGWTNRAGGGGGGRIALYYQSNNYTGQITAKGGAGAQIGGAGSVYYKSATQTWGQINLYNADSAGASTPLPEGDVYLDAIESRGGGRLEVAPATILHLASNDITLQEGGQLLVFGQLINNTQSSFNQINVIDAARLTVANGGQLDCDLLTISATGRVVLNDDAMLGCKQADIESEGVLLLNAAATFSQMHIYAGGLLTHTTGDADFELNVSGDLTVDTEGKINANGLGFGQAAGPGAGASSGNGGGGGYGGRGGNGGGAGGGTYGDPLIPIDLGSGGGLGLYGSSRAGGGRGGGKVTVNVGGTLTVDGVVSANGTQGGRGNVYLAYWSGGGGSGGSVHLSADTLVGSGTISAIGGNGGWGNRAGGGGGGRMALYYNQYQFGGNIEINGGVGANYGKQGSVFTIPSEHQLQLGLESGGVFENPFSSAVWRFNADANRQVRLEQLVSTSGIVYQLSGPDGWVGFTDLNADSDLINLPVAGEYLLTIRSTGGESNKQYQFRMVQTPVQDISVGAAYNGVISSADKARLFRIAGVDSQLVQLTLEDSNSDGREMYVKFGSPPSRNDYDHRTNSTTGAYTKINLPVVSQDTLYVLLYAPDADTERDFHLRIETSGLLMNAFTPGHASNAVPLTLTLLGQGFNVTSTVELVDTLGNRLTPASIDAVTENKIISTYNAGALPEGSYKIIVSNPDGEVVQATNNLEILGFSDDKSVAVGRAFRFIYDAMDKYHRTLDIYTDFLAGGNHFIADGRIGNVDTVSLDENWVDNCYRGLSCVKVVYSASPNSWGGGYWLSMKNNWGTVKNGGLDLNGAKQLSFWARGENGGEQLTFILGGVEAAYGDSMPEVKFDVTLTNWWQQYTIDVSLQDLSHVVNGFAFTVDSENNSSETVFYLDDIQYDKARLDEPRFIESFVSHSNLEPDLYFRNAALTYDNALSLLALLVRGNGDDIVRAKLIADAFVIATLYDRDYNDARLRNAYRSGDLQHHKTAKTRLPGWWNAQSQTWEEDKMLVGTHTGNMAWVIIALTESAEQYQENQAYIDAATAIGEWIEVNTRDDRGNGGYKGGMEGWAGSLEELLWKSTEHNMDVYIAFSRLFDLTGDEVWEERAEHAHNFVISMWNTIDGAGHFFTGTLDDGIKTNLFTYPVDIQALANLFSNEYSPALTWAEQQCYVDEVKFEGFDFNTDRDGIWFEGTAQMVRAYQLRGKFTQANRYLDVLRNAQLNALPADGRGIVAASQDNLTTGFAWEYFSRLHIGATAWYLFAELEYNPYAQKSILKPNPNPNPGTGNGADSNSGSTDEGGGGFFGASSFWVILILVIFFIIRIQQKKINN